MKYCGLHLGSLILCNLISNSRMNYRVNGLHFINRESGE